jgi:exopolyphosphatase/guanosine-5'-triphosphate,3'-diphosphate pyrophosphatase
MTAVKKRVAIIDMGTNTFHLLIADLLDSGSFNIIRNDKIAVKLGQGGISKSKISVEAQSRGLKTLKEYRKRINEDRFIEREEVYATSALRSATNSEDFLDQILIETGFSPKIIDGKQEAEFIYYGVLAGLTLSEEPNLIMDIGGGSVEFIIANDNHILWCQSFEIGAQRLLDAFQKSDPISKNELAELEDFLDHELVPLLQALQIYKPETLIGVSGTFDTLTDILEAREDQINSSQNPDSNLLIDSFEQIRIELTNKTIKERIDIPGLPAFRAEMIAVAMALIHWLLKQHHFNKIRVSRFSLKEGILYSMIKRNL